MAHILMSTTDVDLGWTHALMRVSNEVYDLIDDRRVWFSVISRSAGHDPLAMLVFNDGLDLASWWALDNRVLSEQLPPSAYRALQREGWAIIEDQDFAQVGRQLSQDDGLDWGFSEVGASAFTLVATHAHGGESRTHEVPINGLKLALQQSAPAQK